MMFHHLPYSISHLPYSMIYYMGDGETSFNNLFTLLAGARPMGQTMHDAFTITQTKQDDGPLTDPDYSH